LNISKKETKDWVKPKFCNGIDCPVFEVKEKATTYELRHYPAAQWVSTDYYAINLEAADMKQTLAFKKLFNYISGENEAKQKIAMTAPVLIDVVPGPGPNCETLFSMAFYVPAEFQGKAPAATASDVRVITREPLDVYVGSFGGYANNAAHLDAVQRLAEDVGVENIETGTYFTAGYDSPFKFWNRHNESWLKKAK